jgi:hypothetical protein
MTHFRRIGILAVFVAVSAGLLLWGSACSAQEGKSKPRLQGTFVQLTAAHREWPQEKWQQLFQYFRQLKLSRLIIQWSVYDDLAFFPTKDGSQVSQPPLETILSQADEAHLEVLVGLVHDPGFWEKINREPKLVEVYLRRLRLRGQEAAQALLPMVQAHSSFRGWYLPEEVDDVHWQNPEAQRVLSEHLRDLGLFLRKLTPDARLAISGFANARMDPQTLGNLWKDLLAAAPIDMILFQDGVGAGKLSLEDLPPYLTSLHQAAVSQGRDFQVVVELFRQISAQPFRAEPAPWPRLERQMAIASKYSESGMMAFSVPEYLTPLGGPEAAKLFENYLGWMGSAKVGTDLEKRNNP